MSDPAGDDIAQGDAAEGFPPAISAWSVPVLESAEGLVNLSIDPAAEIQQIDAEIEAVLEPGDAMPRPVEAWAVEFDDGDGRSSEGEPEADAIEDFPESVESWSVAIAADGSEEEE